MEKDEPNEPIHRSQFGHKDSVLVRSDPGGRNVSRVTSMFQSMAESIAPGGRHDSAVEEVDDVEFFDPKRLAKKIKRKMTSKPIADLFPQASVLFADIVGFTAWSSVREPSHVFTLLESIFDAFDEIAKREKVFKVETIGDCYVAATGLPYPCVNHGKLLTCVESRGYAIGLIPSR